MRNKIHRVQGQVLDATSLTLLRIPVVGRHGEKVPRRSVEIAHRAVSVQDQDPRRDFIKKRRGKVGHINTGEWPNMEVPVGDEGARHTHQVARNCVLLQSQRYTVAMQGT